MKLANQSLHLLGLGRIPRRFALARQARDHFGVRAHEMYIRDATLDDATAIGELMTELGYPTSAEAMQDRLNALVRDSSYVTLVADVDNHVVGVIGGTTAHYYEKDGLYARLLVLAVSSESRGSGIGAQLVTALERWAVSRGARDIIVNSAFHRTRAHAFYERLGYAGTGVRLVKTLA